MRQRIKRKVLKGIDQKEFHDAVKIMKAFSAKDGPDITKDAILFKVGIETLYMSTSDLETFLTRRFSIDDRIVAKNSICVSAKTMVAMSEPLDAKNGDQVRLNVDELNMDFSIGKDHAKISGTDATDYPECPALNSPKLIRKIEKEDLGEFSEKLEYVLKAVSSGDTRYNLTGAFFESKTMTSTDGHRLHQVKFDLDMPEDGMIIPKNVIALVLKLIKSTSPDSVQLWYDKNTINIVLMNDHDITWEIVSRKLDGQFPDYQQVIPDTRDRNGKNFVELFVQKEQLVNAMRKSIKLLHGTGVSGSKFNFDEKENKILVITETNTECQIKVEMEIPTTDHAGTPKDTASFNPHYVLDAVNLKEAKFIKFWMNDSLSPGVLIPRHDYLAIVMPMKI